MGTVGWMLLSLVDLLPLMCGTKYMELTLYVWGVTATCLYTSGTVSLGLKPEKSVTHSLGTFHKAPSFKSIDPVFLATVTVLCSTVCGGLNREGFYWVSRSSISRNAVISQYV